MFQPVHGSMAALVEAYHDQVAVFVLILARFSGLLMTAPAFGARSIPIRIRALIATAMALLISPLFWQMPLGVPSSLLQMTLSVSMELVIGMTLGLGVKIVLLGVQLMGQIAGHMSGMQLADVADANSGESVPILSQFLDLLALAVFLIIGGHRVVMQGVLHTFDRVPPGKGWISAAAADSMAGILTESFLLGLRASGPIVVSLLTSILILGLISRTLPQLNILAIGFSMNTILMMATIGLCLGSMAWLFNDKIDVTVGYVLEMFVNRDNV